MGANEKHAATYHAWTPVTSFVMGAYEYDRSQIGGVSAAVSRAEFDRWLETVRAEAKAEALNGAAEDIARLDADAEIYDENLNAIPAEIWLQRRAAQYRKGTP